VHDNIVRITDLFQMMSLKTRLTAVLSLPRFPETSMAGLLRRLTAVSAVFGILCLKFPDDVQQIFSQIPNQAHNRLFTASKCHSCSIHGFVKKDFPKTESVI